MSEIYFVKGNKVYSPKEIAMAMDITWNLEVCYETEIDSIRAFLENTCIGSYTEIHSPDCEWLVQHGRKADAVHKYWADNPGVTIRAARDAVEKMEWIENEN